MAEEDLGAWDDEDYAPPDLKVTGAYGEEVVKKLDEDEKKPEPVAPAAQKDKSKKPKGKDKDKDKGQKEGSLEAGIIDAKPMTPQELEDLQRASDLAAAAEIFGTQLENTIDLAEPTSKEDYDKLLKFLSGKLGSFSKNELYFDFLSNLFTDLCVKLDSEHIRRYGKELTALGAEKLKEEKEKEKAKQPKSKKKPTLINNKKAGDLDDVVGDSQGFADYGGDDEDFM